MITAASPHNIELTQIHLQYHLSSFLFISMLENLLLLLTVALAETIPLLSVSMSSLSSIVLPSPAWLLVIHRYSTVHCIEGGFVDSSTISTGTSWKLCNWRTKIPSIFYSTHTLTFEPLLFLLSTLNLALFSLNPHMALILSVNTESVVCAASQVLATARAPPVTHSCETQLPAYTDSLLTPRAYICMSSFLSPLTNTSKRDPRSSSVWAAHMFLPLPPGCHSTDPHSNPTSTSPSTETVTLLY